MPDIEVYPWWKRGKKNNLKNLPISNGNVLVTTDTEELYIDIDGKRLNINDVIRLTEQEILNTTNPKDKLYFAIDVGKIYYYDGEWKSISGSGKGSGIVFEIRDDGCLYMICEDENDIDKFYINDNGCLIYKLQDAELTEVNLGKVVGEGGGDCVSISKIEQTITSTTDGGTNEITVTLSNGEQSTININNGSKGATGDPGNDGEAAGFGTPTASIDNNTGIPSVTITASGSNTAKVFHFEFKNLKGEKGDSPDLGGLRFGQDEEGKWGYIAPGADTVIPFKTGDGGGIEINGYIPLIGAVPLEIAGSLWFEAEEGETIPEEAEQGAYMLSTLYNDSENAIWCEDGNALTIKSAIPTSDTGEVGCFWIE